MPSFKQPGEEPQTETDILVLLLAARARLDTHLDDNACPTVCVISHRTMTDQLRSSEELNDPDHSLNNAEAQICKQSWTNEKLAVSVRRVARPDTGQEILNAQVQEFEPNQDAGTRQLLSVQVDVSDVRLLRPSTRLVLAMNSMDFGLREGARGVIDTAAPCIVAGRAWDRAYRQICAERGIGHLINVMPESEVHRFGNGGLLTSTERVTVPVVLADHPLFVVLPRCGKPCVILAHWKRCC